VKLTKVKVERASDAVYNMLRESILDQTFRPGERLNVRLLAEKLEVSLTPIKDAVTRLVVEGLIELRPRSGTYVSSLSPGDIQDTLAVRRALERLAAETIFRNMTNEDLDWFEDTVMSLERPVNSTRERQLHEKKNNEFHLRLIELSANKKLIELYNSLNAHMKIARIHYTNDSWAQRLPAERREHRKILEALQAKKIQMLQNALDDHIERATAALVDDLQKKELVRDQF
jgi:DNA-binding GntR family transcriptional regulator